MDPKIGSDMRDRPATLERQTDAALKQLLGVLPRSRHDSGESPLPRTASWFRGPRETRSGSAGGRSDWLGWVELQKEPLSEISIKNRGRVLKELATDVQGVVE